MRNKTVPDLQHVRALGALAIGGLIVLALTGGSARADIPSLLLLRPAAALLIAASFLFPRADLARDLSRPALFVGLLAALILVQLVPMPPSLWSSLPGREIYLDTARLAGIAPLWMPLSIAPMRTLNSLLALLPIAAALLLLTRLPARWLHFVPMIVVGLACLSALLGIVQLSGGEGSFAYLYRFVGESLPTGLFANRNHQAVLLAASLPFAAVLFVDSPLFASRRAGFALSLVLALIVFVLFATGSRSGMVALLIGGLASILILSRSALFKGRAAVLLIGGAGSVAILVGIAAAFGRLAAYQRFLGLGDLGGEMRYATFSITTRLAWDYLPFGSGFGSFDTLFRMHEPDRLLKPTYFNAAHNDWLELVITAGVPGALVALLFLGWFGLRLARLFAAPPNAFAQLARASAAFVVIALVASISDYPLRTPLMGVIFLIACVVLEHCARAQKSSGRDGAGLLGKN
ncbi:O-antigen ligase family protein [Sphingomonas sp.]|uniref:O-antigen ligase family protein n=1 Tax=Sphingomonas sp. TaxID=28214 RepID=UPI002ED91B02